ncbi:unnamed protein product [Lathyrus sativus]|nr:unnamed protein product [Lathyrus sativus]
MTPFSVLQSTFMEKARDDVERLDGGTVFKLWTDSAGGRSRGRVYGTADLAINVKHGSTSFIQQPQNSCGSLFGTSFELETASRITAEQLATATLARIEEATKVIQASNEIARKATKQYQASNEFAKKMESELNALKAFIMQKLDLTNGQSASVVIRSSNPHYDDDLDDQSLSED